MGTGESGIYYTSHGSTVVHHGALIHSFDGEYKHDSNGRITRLASGGHGQSAMDLMDKNGIEYNVVKTYPNGVRVGNVPNCKNKSKQTGTGMSWFPPNWTVTSMVRAGEYVVHLKRNQGTGDGVIMWGTYKGVRIGVIKTNGQVATIFPDSREQPNPKKRK